MSFDLERKGGSYRWSNTGWPAVMELAEAYGWQPAGTAPPEGVERAAWDRGYGTNDGQTVSAQDAKHLADALDAGLEDAFTRVTAQKSKEKPPRVTEVERNAAIEQLFTLGSMAGFEVVEEPRKPGGKPKTIKPSRTSVSIEEVLEQQGIGHADLAQLLTAVYSNPARPEQDEVEWFAKDEGKSRIRDFITFCRKGSFRIL